MAIVKGTQVSNKIGPPGQIEEQMTGTDDDAMATWTYTRNAASYPVNSTQWTRKFRESERGGYTGNGTGKLDNKWLDWMLIDPPQRLENEVAWSGDSSGNLLRKAMFAWDAAIDQSPGQYGLTVTLVSDGDPEEETIT